MTTNASCGLYEGACFALFAVFLHSSVVLHEPADVLRCVTQCVATPEPFYF